MNAPFRHPNIKKLERVLDMMGGLYTASDILANVRDGKMQMHAEGNSIAVTQIGLYPRQKVVEIVAVVGDIDDLRILHDRILTFAELVGAGVIQAYGRKGWLADAKKRGWKTKARSFVFQREM